MLGALGWPLVLVLNPSSLQLTWQHHLNAPFSIPIQQDSAPVGLAADTVSTWLPDSLLSLRASQGNLCNEEAGGFLSPLFLTKQLVPQIINFCGDCVSRVEETCEFL